MALRFTIFLPPLGEVIRSSWSVVAAVRSREICILKTNVEVNNQFVACTCGIECTLLVSDKKGFVFSIFWLWLIINIDTHINILFDNYIDFIYILLPELLRQYHPSKILSRHGILRQVILLFYHHTGWNRNQLQALVHYREPLNLLKSLYHVLGNVGLDWLFDWHKSKCQKTINAKMIRYISIINQG